MPTEIFWRYFCKFLANSAQYFPKYFGFLLGALYNFVGAKNAEEFQALVLSLSGFAFVFPFFSIKSFEDFPEKSRWNLTNKIPQECNVISQVTQCVVICLVGANIDARRVWDFQGTSSCRTIWFLGFIWDF